MSSGVGDLSVASVGPLPDPCPAPGSASGGRRRLGESQRLLYAPFGGQGGLLYDRDAVYLDIGGSHSHAVRNVGCYPLRQMHILKHSF